MVVYDFDGGVDRESSTSLTGTSRSHLSAKNSYHTQDISVDVNINNSQVKVTEQISDNRPYRQSRRKPISTTHKGSIIVATNNRSHPSSPRGLLQLNP
jgi:hypothetical protein